MADSRYATHGHKWRIFQSPDFASADCGSEVFFFSAITLFCGLFRRSNLSKLKYRLTGNYIGRPFNNAKPPKWVKRFLALLGFEKAVEIRRYIRPPALARLGPISPVQVSEQSSSCPPQLAPLGGGLISQGGAVPFSNDGDQAPSAPWVRPSRFAGHPPMHRTSGVRARCA